MAMIDVNWRPEAKQLRQFGIFFAIFFGLVGYVLHYRWGWISQQGAMIVWGIGAAVAVIGMVAPPVVRPLYIVLIAVTLPIGYVVSHVLLGIIYYGVVTPIGILRRMGHDPMERKILKDAPTYWIERPAQPPAKRYFRQY